jgi:phage baseplate assembly protein V
MDARMHDLSDGFALVGHMSQARKIGGISTSTAQLRSDNGSTYVELDPAGSIVNIVAPGGVKIDAPTVTITGDTLVEKSLTYLGGMTGSGGSGGSMNIVGNVNFSGSVTSNGKAIDSTHTHSGVVPGGGNTGAPI